MVKLKTENPIAYYSLDHQSPLGSINDNNTNVNYINEIKSHFNNNKINVLDLGCSGGQIVIDHHNLGDLSVGLEGSDSVLQNKLGAYNWRTFHNKNLFFCDITEDFSLVDENDEIILFDVIQMWDVLEHIPESKLPSLFKNIKNHMKSDGIFIGQISQQIDPPEGPVHHVSVFGKDKWKSIFLESGLKMDDYPFSNTPRPRLGTNRLVFPDPNFSDGFPFISTK